MRGCSVCWSGERRVLGPCLVGAAACLPNARPSFTFLQDGDGDGEQEGSASEEVEGLKVVQM